jgi:hypothetical protein
MSSSSGVIEKPQSIGASIVPAARMEEARRMSSISRAASVELIAAANDPIVQAVIIAQAAGQLREAITAGIMSDLLKLANTPLGFRTDRGPGSAGGKENYPDSIIKDCLIQALIRGLRPTGNEFNIIAGNMYVTKDGFRRLLREFPGLSGLQLDIGTPKAHGEGAIVPCKAAWLIDGQPQSIDCTGEYSIPVKGVGVDLLVGKAESKLLRRIYQRLVGSDIADIASAEESA